MRIVRLRPKGRESVPGSDRQHAQPDKQFASIIDDSANGSVDDTTGDLDVVSDDSDRLESKQEYDACEHVNVRYGFAHAGRSGSACQRHGQLQELRDADEQHLQPGQLQCSAEAS